MSASDRQYMPFFSNKKAPYIFRKSSVGWLLRGNPLNLMTLPAREASFFDVHGSRVLQQARGDVWLALVVRGRHDVGIGGVVGEGTARVAAELDAVGDDGAVEVDEAARGLREAFRRVVRLARRLELLYFVKTMRVLYAARIAVL